METIKDRILKFIETLPYGQDKFEKKCSLSRGYVNKLGDNMTAKTQGLIQHEFPSLNMDWVLTGKGEMIISGKEYNIGEAIKKIEAISEVTLSAVSELLAKSNGGSSTSILKSLEDLVNERVNK